MSSNNYISKLLFCKNITSGFKTFTALIINSKRYSTKFKKNSLDLKDNETFVYHIKKDQKKFDLFLRTFKGDIDIFYEIFWNKTYDEHLSFVDKEPKIIVDLGAHIGMTSIYFALKYPNAKIYSIEASSENFEILKVNTHNFSNITTINAAANFEDGTVNFGNSELSYNQKISENGKPTQAISIESLINTYNLNNIDLLKIDIEGGEIDLLSKNNSWLNAIKNIIIEIHKPYNSEKLDLDLKPFNFNIKLDKGAVLTANKE
ncbi:FkbM family methyltransferase [Chryseobacterium polytrichastri]|uniref:Methyltransferase, FkbM family n=1 Tax=Chryseobacterium polytrichastri TaxID=1302687 RepID=A0A1M7J485_9FLAO|nr:FkbM family methyltransferase [Chryseobacterium polytrichastri]SHM47815.1 methyltransferase, FkbM family [Chryseobacterium polytrichastri]